MSMRDDLIISVFDRRGGTFLGHIVGEVGTFTKSLGGGVGACTIDVAVPFDELAPVLVIGNHVEIERRKTEAMGVELPPSYSVARTIYSGYISSIQRSVGEGQDGIRITLMGYEAKLAMDVYRDGTNIDIAHSSEDVGAIVADIIAKFVAAHPDAIKAQEDWTIDTSAGPSVSMSFKARTYAQALADCVAVASNGEDYFIDEHGTFHWLPVPSAPTHRFVYGRHIMSLVAEENLNEMRNALLLSNGNDSSPVVKLYEDADSIERYAATQLHVERAAGLPDAGTLDEIGARFIADVGDAPITLRLVIKDGIAVVEEEEIEIVPF